MAGWPSATPIATTNVDADTDSPLSARVQIKQVFDDVNTMKAAVASATDRGAVELATDAEAKTATDNTRAMTAANVAATKGRGALAYGNSVNVANNTTTVIDFDIAEDYDTDSIHSLITNSSRMVVPTGVTVVELSAGIRWNGNATGYREIRLRKNGTAGGMGFPALTLSPPGTQLMYMSISSAQLEVSAADYFQIEVKQTSGAGLIITGGADNLWFAMKIIK